MQEVKQMPNPWDNRDEDIPDEESKRNLDELNKKFFPDKSDEVNFKNNPTLNNNLNQSQNEGYIRNPNKNPDKNPSALKKIGNLIFGKSPSLVKRGAKVGQVYTMKSKVRKYKYQRDEFGRAIRKIGLNPAFKENQDYEYRYNKKSGKWQFRRNPILTKKLIAQFNKGLQPRFNQSDFESQKMKFYQQQMNMFPQKRLNPSLEVSESTNRGLENYNEQLRRSNFEYEQAKIEHARRVKLVDEQRKQREENLRQSQILNSGNMFSRDNPFMQNSRIDILQNIFSSNNPNNINLMQKRTDSIDILSAKSIMNTDPNTNILKAPNLFS